MRQSLGDFPLLNRHTGEEEWATLFKPIAESNVVDFETRWRPEMQAKLATLKTHDEVQAANLQDAHWKWREKQQARSSRFDWESFAVECGGETQGLMFVRTVGFARIGSQHNLPLIYIDLISAAPWNRFGFTDSPLYKGVGPLLMGAAISLSFSEGLDGRLGLHALPQSEDWYRAQGMTELGTDTAHPEKLVYFEFTSADARNYVSDT